MRTLLNKLFRRRTNQDILEMVQAGISPYVGHRYNGPPCATCGSTRYDFGLLTPFVDEQGRNDLGWMMPCENEHQTLVADEDNENYVFIGDSH